MKNKRVAAILSRVREIHGENQAKHLAALMAIDGGDLPMKFINATGRNLTIMAACGQWGARYLANMPAARVVMDETYHGTIGEFNLTEIQLTPQIENLPKKADDVKIIVSRKVALHPNTISRNDLFYPGPVIIADGKMVGHDGLSPGLGFLHASGRA